MCHVLTMQISNQILLQVIHGAHMKMIPVGGDFPWQSYNEEVPTADDSGTVPMVGLYEQINVTRDSTDYLWYLTKYVIQIQSVLRFLHENNWLWFDIYSTKLGETDYPFCTVVSSSLNITSDEEFLKDGKDPVLTIASAGHALQVFINGQPSGRWS